MNRILIALCLCVASSLVLGQSSLQDIEARLNKAKAAQAHQSQQKREAQQREAQRQAQVAAENQERYRQQETARQTQEYQARLVAEAQQAAENQRHEKQQCVSQCSRDARDCLGDIDASRCSQTDYSSPEASRMQIMRNVACMIEQNSQRKSCNAEKTSCERDC